MAEEFKNRLLTAIKNSPYSDCNQVELAKLFNVSQATTSYWLSGGKVPRIRKAAEIASTLGVDVVWLLQGDGGVSFDRQFDKDARELLKYLAAIPPHMREHAINVIRALAAPYLQQPNQQQRG